MAYITAGPIEPTANMTSRHQTAKPRSSSSYPAAPDGRTIYVIGDVHGRLDLLKLVHRNIDEDKLGAGASQTVEIYLGDYIDRGPQVADVISALVRRASDTYAVFLRGNHEQLMLDFLEGKECFNEWRAVGALPSLLSYGLPAKLISGEASPDHVRSALAHSVPQEHIDFLWETGSYCAVESYLMVHAGIRPGVRLEDQQAADLFGIRSEFLEFEGDLGCIVVHGHTPVLEPDFRPNRINIDTGAFATNRLTCLRIGEDGARVLCSTGSQ
jgi:Calcineurin-like phosphoesterase